MRIVMVFNIIVKRKLSISLHYKPLLDLIRECGSGSISLSVKRSFLEVVISNPVKKNAISGKMMAELANIADEIEAKYIQDDSIAGLLIRGEGDIFSAGADLHLTKDVINTPGRGVAMCRLMTDILNRISHCKLISISAMNGPAIGGGAELALATDYRVMSSNSYFKFVQAKLGITPAWGGTNRLVRMVGQREALQILATSKVVPCQEAYRLGMADVITREKECANQIAEEFLHNFLKQPHLSAVKAVKSSIVGIGLATSFQQAVDLETKITGETWAGIAHKEALSKI